MRNVEVKWQCDLCQEKKSEFDHAATTYPPCGWMHVSLAFHKEQEMKTRSDYSWKETFLLCTDCLGRDPYVRSVNRFSWIMNRWKKR